MDDKDCFSNKCLTGVIFGTLLGIILTVVVTFFVGLPKSLLTQTNKNLTQIWHWLLLEHRAVKHVKVTTVPVPSRSESESMLVGDSNAYQHCRNHTGLSGFKIYQVVQTAIGHQEFRQKSKASNFLPVNREKVGRYLFCELVSIILAINICHHCNFR